MLALFSNRTYVIHLLLATVATLTLGVVSTIHAQETTYDASFSSTVKEAIPINVLVGQSRVINFDRPIGRFSISNPDIAEAVMVRPDQVLVNGKGFGQVNFIAWEKSDSKFIVFDVFVRANLSLIDSQMRALFPKDDIRLSQANGSVVLSGTVADPATAAQADAVVQAAGFKTVNMLGSPVKSATQVQLQIRVAEVSKNKMRDLGASFAYQGSPGAGGFISGGGPGSLSGIAGGLLNGTFSSAANVFLMGGNTLQMIRAMQQNGALRALAEPNLIAMDGQVASFLAGGEFPIPVIQGGSGNSSVTIQFKEYGIRLNFKPTIIDEDHIRLELEPEVSTIDFANGVRFEGFVVPALRTRRARTGVELRDGQSFALAGLLDNSETRSLSKVPVVGDIPIIGNLFKSTQFQKNETELVFIVTADLVKPVNRDDIPNMRTLDGLKNGSPLGLEPKGEGISGASGFGTGGSQAPAATPEAPKKIVPVQTPSTPSTDGAVKTEEKTKTAPTSNATKLTP
ncbi:MAG TPA: type II and III secretion system protein family protein [Pyrinomonadaceae bacterium]|nr:type II and III secretion system protein family protein [Pyrinomonadaceae bacterium]